MVTALDAGPGAAEIWRWLAVAFARRIVRLAEQDEWLRREPTGRLRLTPTGRRMAERAIAA